MKKILYINVLAAILIVVGSCKKTGSSINPLSDISSMGIGTYLVLDSVVNLNYNYNDIANSTATIQVEQYKTGQTIDHVVLYASVGNSTYDTTQWHMVKSVNYTGKGTALSVSGTELAAALGVTPADLSPGNAYTFYTRSYTKTGEYWDINNTGYANDGTNLVAGSNYHSAFTYQAFVVCPFAPPMAGDYTITRDDWEDYVPLPQVITNAVADGPGANQISLYVYPGPAAGTETGPMIVDVDPATGVATIEKSMIGYYGSAVAIATGSGHVFSCTGVISLSVDFNVGGTDYGSYAMIIVKN